jgi:hypothetical protein
MSITQTQITQINQYIYSHLFIIETARLGVDHTEFEILNPNPSINPIELNEGDLYYMESHLDNRQIFLWNRNFSDAIECSRKDVYATAKKFLKY